MIAIEALLAVIGISLTLIAALGVKCYEIKVERDAFRQRSKQLYDLLDPERECWCENLDFSAASQEGYRLNNQT